MPVTTLTANGTYNLKSMAGYIQSLSVSNAGSAWTLQLNDVGQNLSGNKQTIYGATPGAITVNLGLLFPLYFPNGIQVVLAGTTPGEIDVQWE